MLLIWAPPLRSFLPLRGYGLECRRDEGAWELLDESIPTTQTELLVPGLFKVRGQLRPLDGAVVQKKNTECQSVFWFKTN